MQAGICKFTDSRQKQKARVCETHRDPKEDQLCISSDRREIDIRQHFCFRVHCGKKKGDGILYTLHQEKWGENCLEGKLLFNQYWTPSAHIACAAKLYGLPPFKNICLHILKFSKTKWQNKFEKCTQYTRVSYRNIFKCPQGKYVIWWRLGNL